VSQVRAAPGVARARTPATPGPLARRPETVPIVATVLAWVTLLAISPLGWWMLRGADPADVGHSGHRGVFTSSGLGMLAVMTMAMMAPLAIPGVRTVAFTSLWWRAGRAALWFFAGFMLTWTVFAIVLAPFAETLSGLLGAPATAAGVVLLVCAAAEFDPRRGDLTRSCDRPTRLRANGFDADVDCARFGVLSACRGVRLCGLPMLAMLALPSSLLLMAFITAISLTDRITQGRHRFAISACWAALGAVLLI